MKQIRSGALLGIVFGTSSFLLRAAEQEPIASLATSHQGAVLRSVAEVQIEKSKSPEELSAFDRAFIAYDFAMRGMMMLREGQFDEAAASYREAIRYDSSNPEFYSGLANVLDRAGAQREAIAVLRDGIKQVSAPLSLWRDLGVLYLRYKMFDESFEAYTNAYKLSPHDASLCNNLGAIRLYQNRPTAYQDALMWFEMALQIDPLYVDALANIGHVYTRQGRQREAVSVLERAVAASPEHMISHLNLGEALLDAREYDRAEQEFRIVLLKEPNNVLAYLRLDRLYAEQRRDQMQLAVIRQMKEKGLL